MLRRQRAAGSMHAALCMALSNMSLQRRPAQPVRPALVPARPAPQRGAVLVAEATNIKKRKGPRLRAYEKHWKKRIRKSSFAAIDECQELFADLSQVKAESDLRLFDDLLYDAFRDIDKAVEKEVFTSTVGHSRKKKLINWRKAILYAAGLWEPAEGERVPAPQLANRTTWVE